MCNLRPTGRITITSETFKPNKALPWSRQGSVQLSFVGKELTRRHLVQSQCFSIFAHHPHRSCTRLVTQEGTLPKILPQAVSAWQETAVPILKIKQKVCPTLLAESGLLCENTTQPKLKQSNWKVALRTSLLGGGIPLPTYRPLADVW